MSLFLEEMSFCVRYSKTRSKLFCTT